MAKTHYCRCRINLAGQNCHIVVYDEHNPLSWPEVQVLMRMHGEENVMDVMPVKLGDVIPAREKDRLISIYGHRPVEQAYPGQDFRMRLMMTDDTDLPHTTADDSVRDYDAEASEQIEQIVAAAPVFKPGRQSPRPRE